MLLFRPVVVTECYVPYLWPDSRQSPSPQSLTSPPHSLCITPPPYSSPSLLLLTPSSQLSLPCSHRTRRHTCSPLAGRPKTELRTLQSPRYTGNNPAAATIGGEEHLRTLNCRARHGTLLGWATLHCTLSLLHSTLLHSTLLRLTLRCSSRLHSTAFYSTESTAFHSSALYSTDIYSIAL